MNMSQISNFNDDLQGVASKALEPLSNEYLLDLIKSNSESRYIGVINNNSLLSDIYRARAFAPASSFYGHRYAQNTMCLYNIRPNAGMDLHCTDRDGIIKNSVNSLPAEERIKQAIAESTPIVYLFGGSTIFGQGSRAPEYTIPASIEKIVEIKYKKRIVCINFGLAGTCSRDAFNILISDALSFGKPNLVLFYDGWNCASYLTAASYLKSEKKLKNFLLINNGELVHHFEHNLALINLYNPLWIAIRAIKLFLASILDFIHRFFHDRLLGKVIVAIHSRFLRLRPSDLIPKLFKKMDSDEDGLALHSKNGASEYLEIHALSELVCREKGIKFKWLLQPLVFWGNKPLSANERDWHESGYSSGNPNLFEFFKSALFSSPNFISQLNKLGFHDLTSVFDSVEEEVFIDSGHLNRYGNFLVSMAIADIIFEDNLLK